MGIRNLSENGDWSLLRQNSYFRWSLSVLICILFAVPAVAADIDHWVQEALTNSPELQASSERWQMAKHRVVPADSLADPQLALSFQNYPINSLARDETPMTGDEIRLSQTLPFPGKLSGKKSSAASESDWYRYAHDETRLTLTARVKETWYRLYALDQAITLARQTLKAVEDVGRISETRYATGRGKQQDVLRLQMERSTVAERLVALEQQRSAARANFSSLIGRSVSEELDFSGIAEAPLPTVDLPQLLDGLAERRPLISGYQSNIDRSRSEHHLAELDYYPDFSVWASYRLRANVPGDPVQGEDFLSAGINVTLPIYFAKRREKVAETNSAVRMAEAQKADALNRASAAVTDAASALESNREQLRLYRDGLIPQAEMTYRATLAAYQVDTADFATLLDALKNQYRVQTDYYRLLADAGRNLARLEAEAAVDLPRTNVPQTEAVVNPAQPKVVLP